MHFLNKIISLADEEEEDEDDEEEEEDKTADKPEEKVSHCKLFTYVCKIN